MIAHSDGTATVHVQYTCSGGNVGTHLFIGVKQGPEVNATDHTTSQFAEHVLQHELERRRSRPEPRLQRPEQNARFVVKPDPFFWNAANAPLLSAGTAFVQVCVFDSTNTGEMDPNGFAFDYSMRKVVAN